MTEPGSVTQWVRQLEAGERAAVQQLWEAYFDKLVRMARQKLQGLPAHRADPEDLALSAFKSFCLAAEQKRFPRLEDRHDLWQILLMLTRNKAANLRDYHNSAKRDHSREVRQANTAADSSADEGPNFYQLIESREPDPAFAAEVAEQCQNLLELLPDGRLRQTALRKLEGYTNQEIAAGLYCAPVTVERRLALIRQHWGKYLPSHPRFTH